MAPTTRPALLTSPPSPRPASRSSPPQAHKFAGSHHPDAAAVAEAIASAASPEEAARLGRRTERLRPELLRPDWAAAKVGTGAASGASGLLGRREEAWPRTSSSSSRAQPIPRAAPVRAQVDVMRAALRAKFASHPGPRAMLLATAGVAEPSPSTSAPSPNDASPSTSTSSTSAASAAAAASPASHAAAAGGDAGEALCLELVEASPNDYFWGAGYERTGQNQLGRLLMEVGLGCGSGLALCACRAGMTCVACHVGRLPR
jgi:diaminohydroxyphosphoribosylaminopyrimidine deaminase/5-amino-6-(5-phosphoribosylamino)uracil reductase